MILTATSLSTFRPVKGGRKTAQTLREVEQMKVIKEKFIENEYTANKPTQLIYEVILKNGLKVSCGADYNKALETAYNRKANTIIERRIIRF
jgi:cell division septal protein FtsQ